jgi:hypothetical protein
MVELLMELVYKECVQVDIHVPIIMFAALVIVVAIQLVSILLKTRVYACTKG